MESIGSALLDLETTFYTSQPALQAVFSALGASPTAPDRAQYLFFDPLTAADLSRVAQAQRGSLLAPEWAATLVVAGKWSAGPRWQLMGPGVDPDQPVQGQLEGVPDEFVGLRNQATAFPLGWDLLVVDTSSNPARLWGLPRSTQILEVA